MNYDSNGLSQEVSYSWAPNVIPHLAIPHKVMNERRLIVVHNFGSIGYKETWIKVH